MCLYNYRVVWDPDNRYQAQYYILGSGWIFVGYPPRTAHIDATLDCKLDSKLRGVYCNLDPIPRNPIDEDTH